MKIIYIILPLLFFIHLHSMDVLKQSISSALIVGGAALFVQGLKKQHTYIVERIGSTCTMPGSPPFCIHEWIHEVAKPITIGGGLLCAGVLLWKLESKKL